MKKELKNFVFQNMIGLALLTAFTFLTGNPALGAIGIIETQKKDTSFQEYQIDDPYKILEVLEKKMGGKKLSEKAREKLFSMPQNQTRLIISLCERISDEGRSAGVDIAYLLVIALILLS